MTVLAAIRPDSWNFPLLLHVLGAMLLVGALVLSTTVLLMAWRSGEAGLLRLGYRSLLLGVIPSLIVMRAGAAWIASKEGLDDSNATWIGIGFTTADGGVVLIMSPPSWPAWPCAGPASRGARWRWDASRRSWARC